MVRWHHRLNGHEFEQAPRDGERWGSLACCSPWGHKESGSNEQLNNNVTKISKNSYLGVDSKEPACNAGELGSIPGSGRSPGEENGNPLQYCGLENPMDRRAWEAYFSLHVSVSWREV